MQLDPKFYPIGDIANWNMTIPSHEEYIFVSRAFADELFNNPLKNNKEDIVKVAGERIHHLADYCERIEKECRRLEGVLDNVKIALQTNARN